MTFYVDPKNAVSTYRTLRTAMAILVVVLGAAVVHQILAPDPNCWLGSISAYYYTSARAAFVACLCAIGACLIAYQGNTRREDLVLNISGALAFVVAFIPTPLGGLVVPAEPNCKRSNVPTDAQLIAAVDNNLIALLVGATAAVVVIVWFKWRVNAPLLFVVAGAVAAAWVLFLLAPEFVRAHGHIAAAVALFVGIVLVVVMNGFAGSWLNPQAVRASRGYETTYRLIFGAMAVVCVVLGGLAIFKVFDHTVFWLEALVLVLFATFWALQTAELWDERKRSDTTDPGPPGE